jgi:hypothetical protein
MHLGELAENLRVVGDDLLDRIVDLPDRTARERDELLEDVLEELVPVVVHDHPSAR